ncbi:MAG: hypothetical protein PHQ93_05985 [Sulfurimonas sp.]|uniref:hypothetical protein n=1 Tax=Sulfurimonas sp. TaxID=2022749 RepID=UPI002629A97C|nr:hypothetical protein [Sulfurimonas sp.]MDD5400714.1 hypothetical protein [Sulfurimonas sp.]
MRTIQLEIEDKSLDLFLSIINNLKDGIVKNFKIDDIDVKSDFQAVAQELMEIKNKKHKATDAREFLNDL